ncbi:hypothetical protein GCM10007315_18460 [Gemmobacter tilapiae]|uniref:Uncharacterized protein n=1 Tax=Neogemmobacter tilapiae TaxID=875041 RepID=A0A918TN94_9RHOB|nr:hypothetical protein GCM10007315_18460 [Gemmobacter tilapiae]
MVFLNKRRSVWRILESKNTRKSEWLPCNDLTGAPLLIVIEILEVDISSLTIGATLCLNAIPECNQIQVSICANNTSANGEPLRCPTTYANLAKVCHAVVARLIYIYIE